MLTNTNASRRLAPLRGARLAAPFACAGAIAATLLAPGTARADEPARVEEGTERPSAAPTHGPSPLGTKGQLAINDLLGLATAGLAPLGSFGGIGVFGAVGFSTESADPKDVPAGAASASRRTTTVWLVPSIDYFVVDRVSIGGTIGASWSHAQIDGTSAAVTSDSYDGYTVAVRPRIGYALPLGEDLTWWPRLSIGYDVARGALASDPGQRTLTRELVAELDGGLTARLGRHAFLDAGPSLSFVAGSLDGTSESGSADYARVHLGVRGALGLLF